MKTTDLANFANFRTPCGPLAKEVSTTSAKLIDVLFVLVYNSCAHTTNT